MNNNEVIIPVETQKELMVDILKYIDELCKKNNLTYFMIGGTLLGAVRHKGFIPWDDDVDIGLLREDYEKLIAVLQREKPNRYALVENSVTRNCYLANAKVFDKNTLLREDIDGACDIGVNVDVFPLDYIADDVKKSYDNYTKQSFFEELVSLKSRNYRTQKSSVKKLAVLFLKIIPFNITFVTRKRIKRCEQLISKSKSQWVSNFYGAWGIKEVVPSYIFSEVVQLEFEGNFFSAPAKYDEYLKYVYGNYMQLPPVEDRVTHHSNKAYWKTEV